MISQHHVQMDIDKINVVKNWPVQVNAKELSIFIGFCTYYRLFIYHFAHILLPQYTLLRKDIKFV